MTVSIERAEGGYIITTEDMKIVETNFIDALRVVKDYLSDMDSRYSANRIYIVDLPGDKYEGEITAEQKETAKWLSYLAERE